MSDKDLCMHCGLHKNKWDDDSFPCANGEFHEAYKLSDEDIIKDLKDLMVGSEKFYSKQIEQLQKDNKTKQEVIDKLVGLLSIAKCPNCDGSGAVIVEGVGCEAGCCGNALPNGECCGNAVPVQVPTQEIEQCQWCYEIKALINSIGEDDESRE